jgi:uncharacterized protein (TIGR03435 family)
MMRIAPLLLVTTLATAALAQGTGATAAARMAADAHPSIEVASIRLHDPSSQHQSFDVKGDRVTIRNQTVASMMMFAYAIHPSQIAEAPDWVLHERYDIEGKTDTPGQPNLRQFQEMLQKLLADRFGLHLTREKRELPVYAIQVAKGGPKLTPAAKPDREADQTANGHDGDLTQIYTSATLSDFAMGMQFFIPDRPIIDQSGLTGRYDSECATTPTRHTSPTLTRPPESSPPSSSSSA